MLGLYQYVKILMHILKKRDEMIIKFIVFAIGLVIGTVIVLLLLAVVIIIIMIVVVVVVVVLVAISVIVEFTIYKMLCP